MKKVILLVLLAFVLSGCADDQFGIEKKYWSLQRQEEKIFSNPSASPENELEKVVARLNAFIKKYPKNNLAVKAEFDIANLYTVKEEYNKARSQLKAVLAKYSKFDSICSEAVFLLGYNYEKQNKWSLALEQYKKIMQDYPLTSQGLSIPVYIAQYYKSKFQPDNMVMALQEAIAHYKGLANKYPNSPLGLRAYMLVADCYIVLKDWQNAVNTFKTAIDAYKSKVNVDAIMMNMALIYKRELKNNTKAKEALEGLLKEYPKSKLAKSATALLEEMEKK
ncbi:MAG: tetratricopeptide repeat protein [Candidatus Omnitrophica bacterium]|nr:tetratricopeptide repeat protein [Candidatus Omnitrophota bacterium]